MRRHGTVGDSRRHGGARPPKRGQVEVEGVTACRRELLDEQGDRVPSVPGHECRRERCERRRQVLATGRGVVDVATGGGQLAEDEAGDGGEDEGHRGNYIP